MLGVCPVDGSDLVIISVLGSEVGFSIVAVIFFSKRVAGHSIDCPTGSHCLVTQVKSGNGTGLFTHTGFSIVFNLINNHAIR